MSKYKTKHLFISIQLCAILIVLALKCSFRSQYEYAKGVKKGFLSIIWCVFGCWELSNLISFLAIEIITPELIPFISHKFTILFLLLLIRLLLKALKKDWTKMDLMLKRVLIFVTMEMFLLYYFYGIYFILILISLFKLVITVIPDKQVVKMA